MRAIYLMRRWQINRALYLLTPAFATRLEAKCLSLLVFYKRGWVLEKPPAQTTSVKMVRITGDFVF